MQSSPAPRGPRTTIFLALTLAALALGGVSCATNGGARAGRSGTPPPVPEAAVASAETALPAGIPDEALTELLLAREQAREGLIAEADASYGRVIAALTPLAATDAGLVESLNAVEAERDRVLEVLDAREVDTAEMVAVDEAEQILEGPEPQFHPGQGVEEAAGSIEPDWPVVTNERVLAWVEAYTGRLSEFMAGSIARSGKWEARFREIFAEEGVPQDLIYLAHTESGFKTSAYSRAHARGVFQFISGTARRYGMRIDTWVDERADPEISARASASYLRDLYDEFGCWSLALASYNGGEGRVRRAIKATGERDFWKLASSSRHFRRETRNYVPAIMAATLIAKNPASFGFGGVQKLPPAEFDLVTVPDPADLEVIARVAKTDVATLRELNPALRRGRTPPGEAWTLRVPAGAGEGFAEQFALIPESERIVRVTHAVRRGETLSVIARRYGTSVSAIQAANKMGRRTMLHPGQELEIPRGSGGAWIDDRASDDGDTRAARATATKHRVRRGETLSRIASRYGVSVAELQAWNGLGNTTAITAGSSLRVAAPGQVAEAAEDGERGGTTARASSRTTTVAASGSRYTVRSGDSPWSIAMAHGVPLNDLLALNGLTKRSKIRVGQRLSIPGGGSAPVAVAEPPAVPAKASETIRVASGAGTHVVRSGDTAWSIAEAHGVDLGALLAANGLTRRSTLRVGQALVIPGAGDRAAANGNGNGHDRSYVVRRGDTLARIAEVHGTTVDQICRLNDIRPTSTIHPGDRIALP